MPVLAIASLARRDASAPNGLASRAAAAASTAWVIAESAAALMRPRASSAPNAMCLAVIRASYAARCARRDCLSTSSEASNASSTAVSWRCLRSVSSTTANASSAALAIRSINRTSPDPQARCASDFCAPSDARAAARAAAAATCACVASSAAFTAASARSTRLSRWIDGASLSTRAADAFVFASDACAASTCRGVLTRFVSARTAASLATDVARLMRTASFASAALFRARSAAARMLFCVFTILQWSVPARHGVAMRACVPARSSTSIARRARIASNIAAIGTAAAG
mmetsp:Transcript_7876/g.23336  ORF Transcript_7876/g.23336 Transcript_7876/m.23336 type:complete len:288 (+) Transcript_7876:1345-2208(+)